MTKTARLYGGSLYDLASEEKLTEEMLEQLDMVRALFKEEPSYIPKTERVGLIHTAFEGKIHVYLLNFLKLLCENGMLREFSDCCREFRTRYNEDQGIAEAVVTSAVPLTEEQKEALKARLEKISNKTIQLTLKVDPQVVGGIRAELEGRQLDGTLQERLSGLRKKVTEIIV